MVRTWLQCCAFCTEISLACLPNRADRVLRGVYVAFEREAREFELINTQTREFELTNTQTQGHRRISTDPDF